MWIGGGVSHTSLHGGVSFPYWVDGALPMERDGLKLPQPFHGWDESSMHLLFFYPDIYLYTFILIMYVLFWIYVYII